MKAKFIIFIVGFILTYNLAFADTIYFKSGKEIKGRVLKKTENCLIVDVLGKPLTFSLNEIDHIKEEKLSSNASENKRQFYSLYEVSIWLMYYYQKPDSSELLPALQFLLTFNDKDFWQLEESGLRAGPTIHFFATVFRNNKEQLGNLKTLLKESRDFQKVILNKIIFRAENYKVIEPVDAESFDLLWAEFFATGKKEPILKLINVLGWKLLNDEPGKFADLYILAWSLSANMAQHPLVRQICEEELKNREGITRQRLYEILTCSQDELNKKYMKEQIKITRKYNKKHKLFDIWEYAGKWVVRSWF